MCLCHVNINIVWCLYDSWGVITCCIEIITLWLRLNVCAKLSICWIIRYIASRECPWVGIWKEEPPKNGFSFAGSHLPCRKFIWLEEFLFSFFHWSGITLFSFDLFLFYFLPIFDRESFFSFLFIFPFSFFSFLPFLTFHFSLSISFFGKSGFSIHYLLSLEEIPLSFASGERMRILFIGQGSK